MAKKTAAASTEKVFHARCENLYATSVEDDGFAFGIGSNSTGKHTISMLNLGYETPKAEAFDLSSSQQYGISVSFPYVALSGYNSCVYDLSSRKELRWQHNTYSNSAEVVPIGSEIHLFLSHQSAKVSHYVLPSLECKDTVAFPAPTNHTKLSPDKKYLAVVGDRGYFGYIPLNDNNTLGTPVAIQAGVPYGTVAYCDWNCTSQLIAAASFGSCEVFIWDMETGKLKTKLAVPGNGSYDGGAAPVAFSPVNPNLIAFAKCGGKKVYLADIESHDLQIIDLEAESGVFGLSWHRSSAKLYIASNAQQQGGVVLEYGNVVLPLAQLCIEFIQNHKELYSSINLEAILPQEVFNQL